MNITPFFSSPEQPSGRAIVLPSVLVLAVAYANVKVLCQSF